jgi:hypothetical protein
MGKAKYPPIPSHIRITSKRSYEVVHIDDFKNPEQLGEARQGPAQIVIKRGQSPKEEFSTALHEVIHAVDFENNIGLTETQVLKLERGLLRVLKLNGWLI